MKQKPRIVQICPFETFDPFNDRITGLAALLSDGTLWHVHLEKKGDKNNWSASWRWNQIYLPKACEWFMKYLLFAALFLSACSTQPVKQSTTKSKWARITQYHAREDKWGSRTASGIRAIEGITVAAPREYPFGTKIFIPELAGHVGDGHFIVQDRGRLIVGSHFDIFIEARNRREANKRLKTLGLLNPWMEVRFWDYEFT